MVALSGTLLFSACSSEDGYAHDVNSIGTHEVEPEDEVPDSTEVSEFDGIPEAKDGALYFQQPGTSTSKPQRKSSSSSAVQSSSSVIPETSSSAVIQWPFSSSAVISGSSSSTNAVINVWDWSISAKDFLNPNVVYDSIVDDRDGQKYYVVEIANRRWFAQNLNYSGEEVKGENWCYGFLEQHCNVVGRHYTWSAATVACPWGWRLPYPAEWQDLIISAGGSQNAGRNLKSTVGWFDDLYGNNGNGTDSLGFSAIPAGWRTTEGKFDELGKSAYFWKNSSDTYAAYVSMYYADRVDESYHYKTMAFSVRCIESVIE